VVPTPEAVASRQSLVASEDACGRRQDLATM